MLTEQDTRSHTLWAWLFGSLPVLVVLPFSSPFGWRSFARFGLDLPSQESSRCEVDDRRTRGSEVPTRGSASLLKVKNCGI